VKPEATSQKITRRSFVARLLFLFLLPFAFFAAGCASSRTPTSGKAIRIMTWNIHHAEGMDREIDIDRIAKVILGERPDVVALQEVDRGVERTKKVDIITRLADLTDMTYAFGKTIDYQGGEYGNAILTRFPILEEHNLRYTKSSGGEQRGLMHLVLDVRGDEVVVANTRLDERSNDSARVASVEELVRTLKNYTSRPVIACGDFNDASDSQALSQLTKDFTDTWMLTATGDGSTYPSGAPQKRVDYVFVLKNQKPDSSSATVQIRPISARVVQSSASDHLPLVVELELRTER
jgi:endonuclease/exonuclease/phosphatase family metal-dependent hydrolase